MHSLEQIKFMNTPAEVQRAQALARKLNKSKNASKEEKI